MENASKALLIAGGIFLALIIMSLVVYMATTLTRIADEQDRRTLAEQTVAFNKEYEAYNKKRMYGTDIITVLNKAIEYNGGLGVNEATKFINIKFRINQNFTTTRKTVIETANGEKNTLPIETIGDASINQGEHALQQVQGGENVINPAIKNFLNAAPAIDTVNKDTSDPREIVTTYTYSALTNFKRAIFECTEVHYNEETGRIDRMTFMQR